MHPEKESLHILRAFIAGMYANSYVDGIAFRVTYEPSEHRWELAAEKNGRVVRAHLARVEYERGATALETVIEGLYFALVPALV